MSRIKGAVSLRYTISESSGEKPISAWLAEKLKAYIFVQDGLNVQIVVIQRDGVRQQREAEADSHKIIRP
jgi:hypothetical protein